MANKGQVKTLKERLILAFFVSVIGVVMILGLFFWYKYFAFYNHSIYTYEIEDYMKDEDTGSERITYSVSNITKYYDTVIANRSSSNIFVDIYDNTKKGAPILLQNNVEIPLGEEYRFENNVSAYKIIVYGESITEENIEITASTLNYLKIYRWTVIITMAIGIVMTGIWDLLILFVPRWVENHGEKINIRIAKISAIICIISYIIIRRGYYESNLFVIALLSALLALVMKTKENEKEEKTI